MKIAEVAKRDIPILDYARYRGFTPERVGQDYYTLAEHDSIRICESQNLFFRWSTGQGGSIIDFEMMLDHVDEHDALSKLRDYLQDRKPYVLNDISRPRAAPRPPAQVQEKKELVLPEAAKGRFNRVYAYLNKTRGIDPEIIGHMIKRNQLYEDYRHNCVFVGYDKDNKTAYANIRGTLTEKGYKGDAQGSNKEVGLYINNSSTSLFVTEAPIDSLSIMTMLKLNGRDYKKYDYLALGGISSKSLLYHLQGSDIKCIFLALDHDEAGQQGRENIRAALQKAGYKGKVIDKLPVAKDFNEDLQHILQAGQPVRNPQKETVSTIERS